VAGGLYRWGLGDGRGWKWDIAGEVSSYTFNWQLFGRL